MEHRYKDERNKDFFDTCEFVRKEYFPEYISVEDIVMQSINRETKSFYLDATSCAHIINNVRLGRLLKIKKITRKLYFEIWKRYIHIKRKNANLNLMECARIISEQKAPQFYMSERHAVNLYYKLLKKNPR